MVKNAKKAHKPVPTSSWFYFTFCFSFSQKRNIFSSAHFQVNSAFIFASTLVFVNRVTQQNPACNCELQHSKFKSKKRTLGIHTCTLYNKIVSATQKGTFVQSHNSTQHTYIRCVRRAQRMHQRGRMLFMPY